MKLITRFLLKAEHKNMQIKSIIVDDEKHGRENLAGILEKYCPEIEVVEAAESVEQAIKIIHQVQPELVFLDIEMPKANGFQLLEHFPKANFEVIFVTAHDNYAIKAIRFSAADYILKPINRNDLCVAVKQVCQRIQAKQENMRVAELFRNFQQPQNPRIGLPNGDKIEFVEVQKILRCEGEGNYSKVVLENGKKFLVAKTLVDFEELLNEFRFVRIHKTHLVNGEKIVAFQKSDGGLIELVNGEKLAVSRRRKESVLYFLKQVMSQKSL